MTVLNPDKPITATVTNTTKNAASPKRYGKGGSGWDYDQPEITYDAVTDPIAGLPVFYDSLGTTPVITNLTKNPA